MNTRIIIAALVLIILAAGGITVYFLAGGGNTHRGTPTVDERAESDDRCTNPALAENEKDLAAANKLCLLDAPDLDKPAKLVYKFVANKDAPYSHAGVEIPDGIGLTAGTPERVGSIGANTVKTVALTITAKKAGYYRINASFVAKIGSENTETNDFVDFEVTPNGAIIGKTAENTWGEMDEAIPVNRDNQNIISSLSVSDTLELNKEFTVVYVITSPANLSNATISMRVPSGVEVVGMEAPAGGKTDKTRLTWSGDIKKNQKIEIKLTLVASGEGEGDIFGHLSTVKVGSPLGGISDVKVTHIRIDKYGGSSNEVNIN